MTIIGSYSRIKDKPIEDRENSDVGDRFKGMKSLYFRWLIGKLDKNKSKKYSSLLLHLYKDFFIENSEVPMDVNRARDGVSLRKRFISENPLYGDEQLNEIVYDDCSWFEMILALAERIDDQMMFDMNFGNRADKWFWLIIDQMDLSEYDNDHYDFGAVKRKLSKFIRREYENGGRNGIFKCKNDVRKIEIWYQMMEFFNENCPKIEF